MDFQAIELSFSQLIRDRELKKIIIQTLESSNYVNTDNSQFVQCVTPIFIYFNLHINLSKLT